MERLYSIGIIIFIALFLSVCHYNHVVSCDDVAVFSKCRNYFE